MKCLSLTILFAIFSLSKGRAQLSPGAFQVIVTDKAKRYDGSNLNLILNSMSAEFCQVKDSLTVMGVFGVERFRQENLSGKINKRNSSDCLDNEYSVKNKLILVYCLQPIKVNLNDYVSNRMLDRLAGETDAKKIDSAWNNLYFEDYKLKVQFTPPPHDKCRMPVSASAKNLDISLLNADSVLFYQLVLPHKGTCVNGFRQGYILYKKDVGYITIYCGSYDAENNHKSMEEMRDMMDKLIADTWGCIRFKQESSQEKTN